MKHYIKDLELVLLYIRLYRCISGTILWLMVARCCALRAARCVLIFAWVGCAVVVLLRTAVPLKIPRKNSFCDLIGTNEDGPRKHES